MGDANGRLVFLYVLTAGATERPIAFGNNDRPGIMLAGAVRAYLNRYGVTPGHEVAVFTNNDDGWRTAADMAAKGVHVVAIIDSRDKPAICDVPGARHYRGEAVMVFPEGQRGFVKTWRHRYELQLAEYTEKYGEDNAQYLMEVEQTWMKEYSWATYNSLSWCHFVPDFVCTTPFSRGAEEIVAWHDADPSRRVIDTRFEATMEKIIADFGRARG